MVGSLQASEAAFRTALEAAGARKFSASTLQVLIKERSPKAAAIEKALAPVNDLWIASLDGRKLFELLPAGTID